MNVKCVVLCRDGNGSPDFFCIELACEQAEYDMGDHYELARDQANEFGYEDTMNAIVFDEFDGPDWLFANLFKPRGEYMNVKCVVPCRDGNGSPNFFCTELDVTQAEYNVGDHYERAREQANEFGYEDAKESIVFDEFDGPKWLFDNLFQLGHSHVVAQSKRKRVGE